MLEGVLVLSLPAHTVRKSGLVDGHPLKGHVQP